VGSIPTAGTGFAAICEKCVGRLFCISSAIAGSRWSGIGGLMASIQQKGKGFYCQFIFRGKRHTFALGRITKLQADAKAERVEEILASIAKEDLDLASGAAIIAHLRHGHSPTRPKTSERKAPTLGSLRDRYLETFAGSLEFQTLRGIRRHFKHLTGHFGERFAIRELSLTDLQGYVNARAKVKVRRGTLNPVTIKKELVSLRTAWNWGVRTKIVAGPYPDKGLAYAKGEDKPPFQTRQEIERQLPGLTAEKAGELWESLYLTLPEIERLLEHVKANARHPWIYPLVATAAHTGARKGELLRMRIGDVDFLAGVVTIKEKKRAHDRRTTRRVPLSGSLVSILKEWLAIHPGGSQLFAHAEIVAGSKKRSAKTGYQGKDRPTAEKARQAGVKVRVRRGILPITEEEAHHHFKQSLKRSQWEVIRGWHVLRHSFVSACASKGVDLRMLQEWCGHMSADMQRRYMHMYPSVQAEAIKSVFG
jgi:integrase